MANYKIEIKKSAAKELRKIPSTALAKIVAKIQSLSSNPRPFGSKKLVGQDRYRVRQGDYRILYTIEDDVLVITVVKVANRKESYR